MKIFKPILLTLAFTVLGWIMSIILHSVLYSFAGNTNEIISAIISSLSCFLAFTFIGSYRNEKVIYISSIFAGLATESQLLALCIIFGILGTYIGQKHELFNPKMGKKEKQNKGSQ